MKSIITAGHTSIIRHIFALDSTATDGSGKTGLAFGDMTCYYVKPAGTLTAVTVETIATLGTYAAPTSNAHIRFKLMHDTNAPGVYELQFHNDWFASGAGILIQLRAGGMAPVLLEFQIGPVEANMTQIGGAAQRAADLAEIAQYFIANSCTLTDIVADNSILAKMLADGGDISDYVGSTDSNEGLAFGIAVANTYLVTLKNSLVLASTTVEADDRTTTTFRLADGSASNDAYNGAVAVVYDSAQYQAREITDYTGATKLVTVSPAFTFTPASAAVCYVISAAAAKAMLGTAVSLDSGTASVAGMLAKMADDNGGADFDAALHSFQAIRNRGDAEWITGADLRGAGGNTRTVTVTSDADDSALSNCAVWLTTDIAGATMYAGTLYTNDSGEATFMVDEGSTYYLWRQKQGYNFTQPYTWTVE